MKAEDAVEDAFWHFSLAFYDRPGVAQMLIALQDRDGLDVNLVLFALWHGASGRGTMSTDLLTIARREAAALRNKIVEPLRRLRRGLRHHRDSGVRRLRESVKELELEGEKLVQALLARLASQVCPDELPEIRLAAARANLALYLREAGVREGNARVVLVALDEFLRDLCMNLP